MTIFLVMAYPPRSGKSRRRLHLGLKNCAVSALVWKDEPSPPWYGKSRRIHRGREEFFLCRAVSASVAKSRRLRLGLENRAVSALIWAVSNLIAKVAPHPPRGRKIGLWMRHLRLGHESRAVSNLVWKVEPSPPQYGKSRRIHRSREEFFLSRRLRLGLQSFVVSVLVWKMSPSPL